MRFPVCAVTNASGISSKSGNPFSIPRANLLVPVQLRSSPNFKLTGGGFSLIEVSVSDSFYSQLEKEFLSGFNDSPLFMDFQTSLDYEGKMTLIGFEKAPPSTSSDLSKKFG